MSLDRSQRAQNNSKSKDSNGTKKSGLIETYRAGATTYGEDVYGSNL
jgi:hypothetical protein